MTKLNDEQVGLLVKVETAKTRIAQKLSEIDEGYETARYDAESPLRQAVLDAFQAGVPIRQIGITGLSTKDYSTVRRLLPARLETVAEPKKTVPEMSNEAIVSVLGNRVDVMDTRGVVWPFWTIAFDGALVFDRLVEKGSIWNNAQEIPTEVLGALKTKFSNGDFTGLE